jgi:hypothetical protein
LHFFLVWAVAPGVLHHHHLVLISGCACAAAPLSLPLLHTQVSLLKKNWQNVRCLYIKSTMGKPFRIY